MSQDSFVGKMKNRVAFRTQLASIMEALAKAAVTEISKLVEDSSVVLRLEVSRSHEEIDRLRRKLQHVERELRAAQEAATRESRSVGLTFENQFEAPEGVFKGGADAATLEQVNEKKSKAQTLTARPDFGFAVKEEHEGELVAQILHQTESEHSSGRLNNVGSEFVMFERDHQLPSSVSQGLSVGTDDPVCANVTEQCSQSQSVLSPLQRTPATSEMSGSSLSSLEKDYHVFERGVVKEEAGGQCLYTEESREMGDTQQTEHEQPPLSTNCNLTPQFIHPGQQQLDMQIRVPENSPDLVSNCNPNSRILLRPCVGDKTFSCAQCQTRFDHFSDFERHQRVHTGEKPFSCVQCGKRFSLSWNLSRHERIHTGNKPFGCVQCGKRFTQGWNLRVHSRIHTGERPYHCTICGKSFNQLITLKTHQKIHYRNELLESQINDM